MRGRRGAPPLLCGIWCFWGGSGHRGAAPRSRARSQKSSVRGEGGGRGARKLGGVGRPGGRTGKGGQSGGGGGGPPGVPPRQSGQQAATTGRGRLLPSVFFQMSGACPPSWRGGGGLGAWRRLGGVGGGGSGRPPLFSGGRSVSVGRHPRQGVYQVLVGHQGTMSGCLNRGKIRARRVADRASAPITPSSVPRGRTGAPMWDGGRGGLG